MKTTFDLPERLVRRAKAAAAEQGRPLRDLVADAIDAKLAADQASARAAKAPSDWETFRKRLVRQPDGTWHNPDGIDDEDFFVALDVIREERLAQQRVPEPSPGSEGVRATERRPLAAGRRKPR